MFECMWSLRNADSLRSSKQSRLFSFVLRSPLIILHAWLALCGPLSTLLPRLPATFTLRKHLAGSNGNSFTPEWNGQVSKGGLSIALSSSTLNMQHLCCQWEHHFLQWAAPKINQNYALIYLCVLWNEHFRPLSIKTTGWFSLVSAQTLIC